MNRLGVKPRGFPWFSRTLPTRYPDREYDEEATALIEPPFENSGQVDSTDMNSREAQSDMSQWV